MYCWDDNEKGLTISGERYIELINICFLYSSFFSLSFDCVKTEREVFGDMNSICKIEYHDSPPTTYRSFYKCTDHTKEILINYVNSLFEWTINPFRYNPEDLIFYRNDGSVFFWSMTHEGICAIYNRPYEDVSKLVLDEGWTNSLVYGVPSEIQGYSFLRNKNKDNT